MFDESGDAQCSYYLDNLHRPGMAQTCKVFKAYREIHWIAVVR